MSFDDGRTEYRRYLIRGGKPSIAPQKKPTKEQIKTKRHALKLIFRQRRRMDMMRQMEIDRLLGRPPRRSGKMRTRPDLAKARNFFASREWLGARYEALLKHGRDCMCCGVLAQPAHVDHIKPRSKYPELALDVNNLQILCRECNLGKSNTDETDWRPPTKK